MAEVLGLAYVAVVVYLAGLFFGLFAWGWWGIDPRAYAWLGLLAVFATWLHDRPEWEAPSGP